MEHSAVLLTCIKIPNGFQAFALSIFEWPFKTGITEDPDEMQHYAAFHLGLHCLQNAHLGVTSIQRVKQVKS